VAKTEYSLDEISSFAQRYGLSRLTPEHLQRMRELATYVTDLGRTLPRVEAKPDGLPKVSWLEVRE
jgi:hypothetical protein